MLVTIDVGNTQTVMGLFQGENLVDQWRLSTARERTTDEYRLFFDGLLRQDGYHLDQVKGVALSSVVPEAKEALTAMAHEMVDGEVLVIGPGVKTGMAINIDMPHEVGADRVVNAVAAYAKLKSACIIVDFGTATTFDCISAKGEYLGGAISPGIGTALDALVTRAAKLPRVEIGKPRTAIGRNTVESMQSGILYGYVSLVDGLVKRLSNEIGGEVGVIATGGLAGTIGSESTTIQEVDQNLTLEGLRLVYLRNLHPSSPPSS